MQYALIFFDLQLILAQMAVTLPAVGNTVKPFVDELRRKRVLRFSEVETLSEEEESDVLTVLPDPRPLPDELVERRELQQRLLQAIGALPPKFRAVVYLRYREQLTFPEIGQALGMPEATAKTYFSRAKPLLRASLAS